MLQQIENRPCVIGDPSCTDALPYTLLPPNDAADIVMSPVYTVEQIRALVGDVFAVGLDLDQAIGQNGGAYLLNSFSLSVNGVTMFSTTGPVSITPLSAGNGYADAAITGFNLAGLAANAQLVFTTNFAGGTAGREQYFLNGAVETPSPTPEPGTWLLLGTGAMALVRRARRA
jgi:hypothetical protein